MQRTAAHVTCPITVRVSRPQKTVPAGCLVMGTGTRGKGGVRGGGVLDSLGNSVVLGVLLDEVAPGNKTVLVTVQALGVVNVLLNKTCDASEFGTPLYATAKGGRVIATCTSGGGPQFATVYEGRSKSSCVLAQMLDKPLITGKLADKFIGTPGTSVLPVATAEEKQFHATLLQLFNSVDAVINSVDAKKNLEGNAGEGGYKEDWKGALVHPDAEFKINGHAFKLITDVPENALSQTWKRGNLVRRKADGGYIVYTDGSYADRGVAHWLLMMMQEVIALSKKGHAEQEQELMMYEVLRRSQQFFPQIKLTLQTSSSEEERTAIYDRCIDAFTKTIEQFNPVTPHVTISKERPTMEAVLQALSDQYYGLREVKQPEQEGAAKPLDGNETQVTLTEATLAGMVSGIASLMATCFVTEHAMEAAFTLSQQPLVSLGRLNGMIGQDRAQHTANPYEGASFDITKEQTRGTLIMLAGTAFTAWGVTRALYAAAQRRISGSFGCVHEAVSEAMVDTAKRARRPITIGGVVVDPDVDDPHAYKAVAGAYVKSDGTIGGAPGSPAEAMLKRPAGGDGQRARKIRRQTMGN